MIPNPLRTPTPFDSFTIGGIKTPGKGLISGASRPYDWDVQQAQGNQGATITRKGAGLAVFTVKLRLWKPEHFPQWEALTARLIAAAERLPDPEALDITAGPIAHLKIRSVVPKNIGQLEEGAGGEWFGSFELHEYRKRRRLQGSVKGSTDTAKAKPVPKDPLEAIVAAKSARNEQARKDAFGG